MKTSRISKNNSRRKYFVTFYDLTILLNQVSKRDSKYLLIAIREASEKLLGFSLLIIKLANAFSSFRQSGRNLRSYVLSFFL